MSIRERLEDWAAEYVKADICRWPYFKGDDEMIRVGGIEMEKEIKTWSLFSLLLAPVLFPLIKACRIIHDKTTVALINLRSRLWWANMRFRFWRSARANSRSMWKINKRFDRVMGMKK
jgi:hypothetical protein